MASRELPEGFAYLAAVIGRPFSSREVTGFLEEIGGKPKQETVEDRTYYVFKKKGIDIDVEEDRVAALFLFSEGRDGHSAYFKGLPEGLSFSTDRKAARRILGKPSKSGGGVEVPVLGVSLPFDRYEYSKCAIVLEYESELEGISLVTVQAL